MGNPIDMIASATAEDYEQAIETVAADPEVDAMIVIYIPPQATKAVEIGHAIVRAIDEVGGRIPVATTWMSTKGLPQALQEAGTRIPSFAFPEQAAIAMAHAARYGRWRERPARLDPRFHDTNIDEAVAILAAALGRGDAGWLTAEEVERLLGCYGLRTARSERTTTPEEAGDAAARIGAAVAIKAFGPDIVHKTEVGAVALGLRGPAEITEAARQMAERVGAAGLTLEGFLVQEMVQDGVEMLVGVAHDPLFGPVVACSAGGTTVELRPGRGRARDADHRPGRRGDGALAPDLPAARGLPGRAEGRRRGAGGGHPPRQRARREPRLRSRRWTATPSWSCPTAR